MDEPLTFEKLLDMAARNGAGPGHDAEVEAPEPDTRQLHKRAKAAYDVWADGMCVDRVWDELKTYEQVAWRNVVRAVSAEETAR